MRDEVAVLIPVFRAKSSLCPFLEEIKASISITLFTSLLPLKYVANSLPSFPRVAPSAGGNGWGERGKAMTPQEGSRCVHLTPAQLTSTHFPLTSLSSEHQWPSLSSSTQAQLSGPLPWDQETSTNSSMCQETSARITQRCKGGECPPLKGELWQGPGPVLQDGGVLSAEGAATSVSPRH